MITDYKEYLNPSFVYIPLTDVEYKIANVKVELEDNVLIGSVLAYKLKGKEKLPVISTVSGKVTEFKVLMDRYGKLVDHCVIENDKQNNQIELVSYVDPSSAQIRNRLYELGIEKMNVDGSYTPLKFSSKISHVCINSIFVNEPSYSTDYIYLQDNAEAIASGILLIAKAALCDSMTLFIDKTMPNEVLEHVGMSVVEKNIDLVVIDSRKLDGKDIKYIAKLVNEQLSDNLLNSEIIYVDIYTAKKVFDSMKGIIPSTTPVALTGDGIKANVIYECKIGTQLIDLVDDLKGYNEIEDMVLHIGDFLTGIQVTSDLFSITHSVDSINIAEYRDSDEDVCIKCGECNDVCPVGILPQNIMDAELRNVNSRIVELNTNYCVECGLCSYVCPSKINVLEWVRRAKRRVG